MNYWQIACGSFGRDYAQEFLRYGMAFVGGEQNRAAMDRVEVGDRVIMKRGITKVVAVGEVVERDGKHKGNAEQDGDSRFWLRDFDGWNLASYCFVEWHVPKKPIRTQGLIMGTIKRVYRENLRNLAERVLTTCPAQRALDPEPRPTKPVEDEEIVNFLISQGLRPGAAEELAATLKRIRRLAWYYYCEAPRWEDIREHETRSFLVIPLLLALGWAEQQMKIELPVGGRQRADLACFSRPYTGQRNSCALVVETKGFSQGLEYAPEQAKTYAKHFPECRTVAVSNGYCYKTYRRENGKAFRDRPSAYLNLLSPRDRYPRDPDNVGGALEVLRSLLPVSCR